MNQKEKKSNIQITDLEVGYEDKIIIDSMNLEIPKGEITMIIGSNGCGKSTLIKSVGRILKPRKGEIFINGENIKKQATKELAKKMAVLPQNPKVPAGLLVKELVAYGRFPYQSAFGSLSDYDREKIDWAMEATNVKEFADRPIDSLSGGQRQRAWIAMAIAQDTEILILDEPTTFLDMAHQLEILMLLRKLNKEYHTTIIMVLHELNNATKFATHLVGMKQGKVMFSGKPVDVITKENLKTIYGIDATLALDPTGTYPICVDFEIAR
ncbi:ferrichrome transport ATP-binding protein FhuC [Lachnospiraceae bacterium KM106-2]|nr:ferrichrome transport ATP-binding protein FhuC [Lachnospiraceae bacterium KM106-2]